MMSQALVPRAVTRYQCQCLAAQWVEYGANGEHCADFEDGKHYRLGFRSDAMPNRFKVQTNRITIDYFDGSKSFYYFFIYFFLLLVVLKDFSTNKRPQL